MKSVPVQKAKELELLDSLEPYLEWQSDPGYLKNPPKGYYYPGYDLFGSLARIKADLKADKYKNEYDLMLDLFNNVVNAAHDGHFAYYVDFFVNAFRFKKGRGLVSISKDGSALPEIKLYGKHSLSRLLCDRFIWKAIELSC